MSRPRKLAGVLLVAVATVAVGCSHRRGPGVSVNAPGTAVRVGPGGVSVRAPGTGVNVGRAGVDVEAPGSDVEIQR